MALLGLIFTVGQWVKHILLEVYPNLTRMSCKMGIGFGKFDFFPIKNINLTESAALLRDFPILQFLHDHYSNWTLEGTTLKILTSPIQLFA